MFDAGMCAGTGVVLWALVYHMIAALRICTMFSPGAGITAFALLCLQLMPDIREFVCCLCCWPCSIYELYSDFVMKNPFYEVEQVSMMAFELLVGSGHSAVQPVRC